MALKNHALDEKILTAAREEFLENGYKNASLRKIAARAGVTVGAIYTRYATKDALFCALVQPLLDRIAQGFAVIREGYYSAVPTPEHMAKAMEIESRAVLHLLFDDYNAAVLLLCRSVGSSLESFFDQLVEEKIRETQAFFAAADVPHPDDRVLRLLIGGQFHMYVDIIRSGYDLAAARQLMDAAVVYHTGGWMALFQQQGEGEDHHEV